MGSQFVDLNADGQLDYLTATFDGSPHVAYGSAEGFGEPEMLKDKNGERVVAAHIWNYDAKKHEVVGRSFDGEAPKERCISAWAFDWDADGDLDLLLGTYENGRLYRQMNEGTKTEPAFSGKNIPVMAGDAPLALPAKMTAPRMVDWDADGDLDLVTGSFGDSWGNGGAGGGVYLARNVGERGAPKFAALETLVEPSKMGQQAPTRPDGGLYPDAVDFDGDGDLDLLVGGYSMWTPPARELSEAETAEAARLQAEKDELMQETRAMSAEYSAAYKAATKDGTDRDSPEAKQAIEAALKQYRERSAPSREKLQKTNEALEKLIPSKQRKPFVWLYERK